MVEGQLSPGPTELFIEGATQVPAELFMREQHRPRVEGAARTRWGPTESRRPTWRRSKARIRRLAPHLPPSAGAPPGQRCRPRSAPPPPTRTPPPPETSPRAAESFKYAGRRTHLHPQTHHNQTNLH